MQDQYNEAYEAGLLAGLREAIALIEAGGDILDQQYCAYNARQSIREKIEQIENEANEAKGEDNATR